MAHFSRIVRVEETGSTNNDVAEMLGEEQARGLVLVAAHQTHGSGRRGRAWVAPPGCALLCTLALPEPLAAGDLWAVPFWAALVVREALRTLNCDSTLQWPNDVLTQRGKIAGILCVSRVTAERAWVGCGIGINVRRPHDQAAFGAVETPVAFVSDTREDASVDTTLQALLHSAESHYALLSQTSEVVSKWQHAARLPAAYRILKDGEAQPFTATALRLASDGSLVVRRSGADERVSLADARVLR